MSTATLPILDKGTRIAVWAIIIITLTLFAGVGVLLGAILGAVLLALVAFAGVAITVVLVGAGLLKLGLIAIESYLRVRAAKLAYAAVQREA